MRTSIPMSFARSRSRTRGISGRIVIAIVITISTLIGYYFTTQEEFNPITQETQRVAMTVDQEIQMGLQAAPQMSQQFGGLLQDQRAQQLVDQVGERIVRQSQAGETEYQFAFHVVADDTTINAFALPGGQIFISAGLLERLETEGQLAGVLAHEIGHVVGRHSAEQMAKARLTQGLTGAAASVLDDGTGTQSAQMAGVVQQLITSSHSREDELESDRLGVRFMAEAGYDPRSLIGVMEILAEASAGQEQPEFFSTHPNPVNRIERIRKAIEAEFPDGVPTNLIQ